VHFVYCAQSESNKTLAAVATALWAVFLCVETSVEVDRPQVRTRDGFVLRRTGGYNICELALGILVILSVV
jgi:hypothetical protein